MTHIDPIFEPTLKRDGENLFACGPSTALNLLVEIHIFDQLDAYRRYPPEVVRALSGGQFPRRPLRLVPRCVP